MAKAPPPSATGGMRMRLQSTMQPQATIRPGLSPFARTCLPLTMALAFSHRAKVEPLLKGTPVDWPFEDRVLVMLAPGFKADVVAFRSGTGMPMETAFLPFQLAHLDEALQQQLRQLLPTMQGLGGA